MRKTNIFLALIVSTGINLKANNPKEKKLSFEIAIHPTNSYLKYPTLPSIGVDFLRSNNKYLAIDIDVFSKGYRVFGYPPSRPATFDMGVSLMYGFYIPKALTLEAGVKSQYVHLEDDFAFIFIVPNISFFYGKKLQLGADLSTTTPYTKPNLYLAPSIKFKF